MEHFNYYQTRIQEVKSEKRSITKNKNLSGNERKAKIRNLKRKKRAIKRTEREMVRKFIEDELNSQY